MMNLTYRDNNYLLDNKLSLDSQPFFKKRRYKERITNFSKLASLDHLSDLLDCFNTAPNAQKRLVRTFFRASHLVKNSKKDSYFGRFPQQDEDTYSFCFTSNREFLIGLDKLAAGSSKKVNVAVDTSNPKQLVKIVVRGEEEVNKIKKEIELRQKLAEAKVAYLIPPGKIQISTYCKPISSTGDIRTSGQRSKYVYFEQKMEGDALSIDPTEIKKAPQLFHDFAKGLSCLHKAGKAGYIHGDAKLENILILDNRYFISDLGYTLDNGATFNGGGTFFCVPPECLSLEEKPKVDPSFDSFSLGVSILRFFVRDIDERLTQFVPDSSGHLGLLNDDLRNLFFKKLKEEITKDGEENKISVEDVQIKLKLINLADQLTTKEVVSRLSCEAAAKQIAEELPKFVITSDPNI